MNTLKLVAMILGLSAPAQALTLNPYSTLVVWKSSATQYLSGQLCIAASSTTPSNCVMRMDGASGNVGIGMNNPSYPLQVQQPTAATGRVYSFVLNRQNSSTPGLYVGHDGVGNTYFNTSGNTNITFGKDVGGSTPTDYVTILNGGNVGIGTTSPCSTCTLHVNGGLSVTGTSSLGFIIVQTSGTATSSLSTTCPAGTILTGGGCACGNAATPIYQNYPETTVKWTCIPTIPCTLYDYAICARVGP
jgi:hypothetical protein